METIKYVVHPGNVCSKTDHQIHFIGAGALMRLYGVNPAECSVVRTPEQQRCMSAARSTKLVHLYPRYDGSYTLPT